MTEPEKLHILRILAKHSQRVTYLGSFALTKGPVGYKADLESFLSEMGWTEDFIKIIEINNTKSIENGDS